MVAGTNSAHQLAKAAPIAVPFLGNTFTMSYCAPALG
jgi:hypothetical protein